jgi:hypothetical protein
MDEDRWEGSNILLLPINSSKYLCIALLPCLIGYLQPQKSSIDSSFDSLLIDAFDAAELTYGFIDSAISQR